MVPHTGASRCIPRVVSPFPTFGKTRVRRISLRALVNAGFAFYWRKVLVACTKDPAKANHAVCRDHAQPSALIARTECHRRDRYECRGSPHRPTRCIAARRWRRRRARSSHRGSSPAGPSSNRNTGAGSSHRLTAPPVRRMSRPGCSKPCSLPSPCQFRRRQRTCPCKGGPFLGER